jgi:hypothetical protein
MLNALLWAVTRPHRPMAMRRNRKNMRESYGIVPPESSLFFGEVVNFFKGAWQF